MKIITGRYKGHKLTAIGKVEAELYLRPTSSKVREALFNILINGSLGDVVAKARVLDLFAGTGALGIEAVSRGADCACLIDAGQFASKLIQKNINILGKPNNICFDRLDACALPRNSGLPYGLVFLDPPYGKNLAPKALTSALNQGWIAANGILICEENCKVPAPLGFEFIQTRKYGETVITVMRAEHHPDRKMPQSSCL